MSRALVGARDRFDRWVGSGPFTARDLAVYRIVFAILMLLRVPRFRVVDGLPDFFFHPPLGPFMVLPGLPPAGTMLVVELALSAVLLALALGYRTTVASWATTLLLLYGYGVSYSVGKIDHTIFLVLLPAVLSFARWGDDLSIDAIIRRRRTVGSVGSASVPQWPVRLLALLIGLGFLTAAIPKIASGWLDPRSQAVRGIIDRQYYVNGRTDYLISTAMQMDVTALWEVADVFAVLLELSFIATVLWWRPFRVVLAVATLFHLGVLLSMNIFFSANVLVYGAFVSWSALGALIGTAAPRPGFAEHRAVPGRPAWWWGPGALVLSVVGGPGVWWLRQEVTLPSTSWLILIAGTLVGCWYLARQAWRLLPWSRQQPQVVDLRDHETSGGSAPSADQDHEDLRERRTSTVPKT